MKRQIIHESTQIAISFSSTLPAANQLSTLLRGHINNFDAKIINQIFLPSVGTYILHKAKNISKRARELGTDLCKSCFLKNMI